MKFPTIHLNGTSGDVLFEQLANAIGALRSAAVEMDKAAPNGRDYYPQGPHALREAMEEHDARIVRLLAIKKELEEICENVGDQIASRQPHERR